MLNKITVRVDLHSATSALFARHNSPVLRKQLLYHCPGEKLPGRDKHKDTCKKLLRDFTGVTVDKNPPANAGHMTWVGSLVQEDFTCCRAIKPMHLNDWSLRAWSPCSATREATATRSRRTATKDNPPPVTTRESLCKATKTQHSQK